MSARPDPGRSRDPPAFVAVGRIGGVPGRSTSALGTARLVVAAALDQRVTFLSAAVAYYAFVSLVPASLLLFVLAGGIFGDAVAIRLLAATGGLLTPAGEEAIGTAVTSAEGRAGAGILGVGVLLWSTLKVFRGLNVAFAEVYGVGDGDGFLAGVVDAGTVVLGVGVGIVAMVAAGAAAAAVDAPTIRAVGVLTLPAVLTVVFLPMYYVLPNTTMTPRGALPGAIFAAVVWTALQAGFQAYAATAGQYQVYGVVAGVLLLVTWLYVAAIVVTLGAVLNAVLAGRASLDGSSDRQLQHDRGRPADMNGESDREGGPEDGESPGREASERTADRGDGSPEATEAERPRGAPDVAALEAEVSRLRGRLEEFETDVERRTVDRPELESELKGYVRARMRRGHARGWGPYLVLLYGTVLTLGAFTLLDGVYAIAAIVVLGLSTLGLYTLFVVVGVGLNLLETPGKALDYARQRGED